MLSQLNAALRERNAGKCGPASNSYEQFITLVRLMLQVRAIPAADASILIKDAQYLISHCP